MATIICLACEATVNSNAETCPLCGADPRSGLWPVNTPTVLRARARGTTPARAMPGPPVAQDPDEMPVRMRGVFGPTDLPWLQPSPASFGSSSEAAADATSSDAAARDATAVPAQDAASPEAVQPEDISAALDDLPEPSFSLSAGTLSVAPDDDHLDRDGAEEPIPPDEA